MDFKVLTSVGLDELFLRVGRPDGLDAYRVPGPVPLPEEWLLKAPDLAEQEAPVLRMPAGRANNHDVENAIALHRWLQFPTAREARDNRLWTWLAHAVFPDFVRARYPLPKDPGAAIKSVRAHWLLRGHGRGAVADHALARLWWAAEATYLSSDRCHALGIPPVVDEYEFTRLLLGTQNVHLQFRDRSFGSNPTILLAALSALRDAGVSHDKGAAWMGRELTLTGKYRCLDSLGFSGIREICLETLTLSGAPKAGKAA